MRKWQACARFCRHSPPRCSERLRQREAAGYRPLSPDARTAPVPVRKALPLRPHGPRLADAALRAARRRTANYTTVKSGTLDWSCCSPAPATYSHGAPTVRTRRPHRRVRARAPRCAGQRGAHKPSPDDSTCWFRHRIACVARACHAGLRGARARRVGRLYARLIFWLYQRRARLLARCCLCCVLFGASASHAGP